MADSDETPSTCTQCGQPVGRSARETQALDLVLVGTLFFLAGMLLQGQLQRPPAGVPPETKPSAVASPSPASALPNREVIQAAQEMVLDHLEGPKGAVFDEAPDVSRTPDGEFRIRSYFDAPNSFGKTIRTRWTVVVQRKPGGGWELRRLESSR